MDAAIDWYTQQADKPWRIDRYLGLYAGRYAAKDPVAALDWVLSLPKVSGESEANLPIGNILSQWAAKDSKAPAIWLRQHLNEEWTLAAANDLYSSLREINPSAGSAFLDSLPPTLREALALVARPENR